MSNEPAARRFFSGTTLERAVLEAAGHYGVDPKDLAYTRQGGGLASRGKVVIKVDPSAPSQPAEDPSIAPALAAEARAERPEREVPMGDAGEGGAAESLEPEIDEEPEAETEAETVDDVAVEVDEDGEVDGEPEAGEDHEAEVAPEENGDPDAAKGPAATERADNAAAVTGELQDLPRSVAEARRSWSSPDEATALSARKWAESLLRLASLDLEVEVHERDGEVSVHLGGADAEVAVDDGGEVLRAIQHLLPRLMLSDLGHTVRCRVDCNDFREIHEEELRTKALQAAQEVLSGAREVTLEPMHPADRRVVHLALAESELVRTESLGRGFFKRVSIRSN